MRKTLLFGSIAVSAALVLSGCGAVDDAIEKAKSEIEDIDGGSDIDNGGQNNGGQEEDQSLQYGFYRDSAVVGIDYQCGMTSGLTEEDGKFTYDINDKAISSGCTFSIGDVLLDQISYENLKPGETYWVNNIYVATLLQALDNNNDLDDGIDIDEAGRKAFSAAMAGAELNGMNADLRGLEEKYFPLAKAALEASGYDVPTLDDASEHILRSRLHGETFLVKEYHNGVSFQEFKLEFSQDMTTITITRHKEDGSGLETFDVPITLSGTTFQFEGYETYDLWHIDSLGVISLGNGTIRLDLHPFVNDGTWDNNGSDDNVSGSGVYIPSFDTPPAPGQYSHVIATYQEAGTNRYQVLTGILSYTGPEAYHLELDIPGGTDSYECDGHWGMSGTETRETGSCAEVIPYKLYVQHLGEGSEGEYFRGGLKTDEPGQIVRIGLYASPNFLDSTLASLNWENAMLRPTPSAADTLGTKTWVAVLDSGDPDISPISIALKADGMGGIYHSGNGDVAAAGALVDNRINFAGYEKDDVDIFHRRVYIQEVQTDTAGNTTLIAKGTLSGEDVRVFDTVDAATVYMRSKGMTENNIQRMGWDYDRVKALVAP